jgi:hypothetical protein
MKSIKSILTALTLGAAALTANATPASEGFGIGVILGSPSGLSLKIPASPANSINVIAGWDLDDNDGRWENDECCSSFYIGGDYIFYNYNLIRVNQGRMPLYYGPGLNASFWNGPNGPNDDDNDNFRIGLRIALGLEYQFATAPFDIFVEIAPGVTVVPATYAYVSAGIGTRFFF